MTATRGMLISIICASIAYFGTFFLLPGTIDNHRLWLAFITYLAMRGVTQSIIYFKINKPL